jgi:tetratricopeptide (TPR) repeat protein
MGRLQDAQAICEHSFIAGKNDSGLMLALAEIFSRLGNPARAEECYRQILQIKPDSFIAHASLGAYLFNQGRTDEAITCYRNALDINPGDQIIHFNLGVALMATGKTTEAKRAYTTAIELQPGYAKAHANLAYLLRQEGKLDEAVTHYSRAISSEPQFEDLHYNLGITLLMQGRTTEAKASHQRALQINPEYSNGHSGLGALYAHVGDYQESISCYRSALKYDPGNVEALTGLTGSLAAIGKYKAASESIRHALKISPDNIDALITQGYLLSSTGYPEKAARIGMQVLVKHPENTEAIVLTAGALEISGEYRKAYQYLLPLLDKERVDANAGVIFATISKNIGMQRQAINTLERILSSDPSLPSHTRRKIHFTLGESYDSLHDYNTAFKHYSSGNDLKRAVYNREQHVIHIDKVIRFFQRDFLLNTSKSSIHSDLPIFIVGMPRSGTSLVEQILSSHSRVFGAGELDSISDIANNICKNIPAPAGYPDCLEELDKAKMDSISQQHLDRLRDLSGGESYVTDKMPSNFMHLGLIEILFPGAHVIHCKRNAMDTCLSCYFQDFGPDHPYTYKQADLGHYHRQYQKIMDHWEKTLSIPIFNLQYEELIEDQKAVTMKLLEFCNLEWEDNCLDFHTNKRLVWTASYKQVNQKLYRKSVARWKNYIHHLAELRKALEYQ